MFADYETPVAYSMVRMASVMANEFSHPMASYMCYWAAFNNIYVTLSDQLGRHTEVRRNSDGSIRTRQVAQVNIPEVRHPSEREQIELAYSQFSDELKQRLIEHPSTHFFVYRTPCWRGRPIERDASGQKLNGVLNVGYTIDPLHPVWTPISVQDFEAYKAGDRSADNRDSLAQQLVDVLYTVRNNTFHGGKRADDANDRHVLEMALPLLVMVVESFLSIQDVA